MVVNKENSCKFCPKVFCCSDCRGAHENSQHANYTVSDCSLCKQKDLVFKPPKTPKEQQTTESHKSELFCHLVSNHLPLYCKLCGTKYKSIDDLEASKPCSWWAKKRALKQTPKSKSSFIKHNNNEQKDSPLYPTNEFLQKENKSLVIRPKQDNYIRQTSTPMQALNQFIASHTPSFEQLPTFETNSSACSSATSSGFESKYYTGLNGVSERLSPESKGNQTEDVSEKQSEAAPAWNGTPTKHEAAVDGSSSKRFRLPAGQPEAEPEDEVRSEAKRMERKRKIEDESGGSPSSSTANCSDEKKVRRVADSSVGESNSLNSLRGPTLVMMMLLDQSNLKGLSDLTPLIDSSLKKLEENNFSSTEKENGSTEMTLEKGNSGSGLILRSCRRASLTLNLSERVECVSGSFQSRQSQEVSQEQQQQPPADSYNPAGIFSAVARVFRCALEKLPALTPQYQSIPETPTEVVPRISPQIKRSLEREDSSASSSAIELYPAAKRYRDWNRIKAREPIARMRTKVHQSTQTEDLDFMSKDAQIAF